MKNHWLWMTRITLFTLCLFVVVFMGYHAFSSFFGDSVRTVTAVLMPTVESLPVSGVVVRDETIIQFPPGLIEFTVEEAERVSAGQTVAVTFHSEEARQNNNDLVDLTARRDLLSAIANRGGIVMDTSALDAELRLRAASLLSDVSSGRLAAMPQQSADIKALLFHQTHSFDGTAVLLPRIERLDEEIAALSGSVSSTALRADAPGLFSSLTDGLETVWTPDLLKTITVPGFQEKNALRSLPPDEGKGRLVRGWTWRFVCVLPTYQAKTLGKTAVIRFTDGFTHTFAVESVSAEEDGECAAIFSSDRHIDRVIAERRLHGELIYEEYEGVRIPREGLWLDEETGGYFVYCLLLGRVIRKDVTLHDELERDNYYLAEYYPGVAGALFPGDEIIVAGKDLYDGKILRQ
ncbi:MAG: hypothetical protein FWG31_08975 [Oscillospiraceae bacterium]|nr:hypothetical protein [Oscillospiraceae bacterium]